jgi:hypothetical protein
MKNYPIVFAVIAALTLGVLGTAQARDAGQRHGAQKHRPAAVQHRAGPRRSKHAIDRHHVRQHARGFGKRAHARPGKRIWRMKARRHWARRHYGHYRHYGKHRRFHRGRPAPHRFHRRPARAYPVYLDSPSRSLGVDVETRDFRFSVNKSG